MKNKLLKKTMSLALASACVFAVGSAFTGCTTSRPEIQMKISFNGETYKLEYELYRKLAPATVAHFIELVDADYYNRLCVHNYTDTKWYMGGYTYQTSTKEFGGLKEKDYFAAVEGLGLTSTVWLDEERTTSTNTLYGEFKENGFSVKNGGLDQKYGTLTMFYTAKTNVVGSVYTKRSDGNGYDMKDYRYNSATSLFYMYVSASVIAPDASYCTFATIKKESAKKLTELKNAIADYIAEQRENDESYSFTTLAQDVPTDAGDEWVDEGHASYNVPKEPILIESITVKKY